MRRFYEETGRYDLDVWSALRDAAGKVVHTGWYRRVKESGVVIYTGFYTTVQPPGHGSRCVKVVHLRSLHEHFEVY